MLGVKQLLQFFYVWWISRTLLIASEERKKLNSWIEIDFGVVVSVEIRPWLFFHSRFYEILDWLRKLSLRAIGYTELPAPG
ncbi:MAG: hypothetical protein B6U85_02880 [Desulfurococcales archaeon ex4484_42]|nr:MAG: hypothetical protein B6U85_02880 [Desulfurococcales archaeon ex4484_42]